MSISNIDKEMGKIEFSYMAFGNVKCYHKFRKLEGSYNVKYASVYVTVIIS